MAPIAIITVTYSPGKYLQDFLRSIPAATAAGADVVLVDNGSTDGAPEAALREWQNSPTPQPQRLQLHYSGGNIGYGAAMNAGARLLASRRAAGEIDPEYVLISNPDVVFRPGAIDALREAAERHPRAGAVGPVIREADGSIFPSARRVPELASGIGHALFGAVWPKNPWTRRYMPQDNLNKEHVTGWLSGSCLLLRWDAFESIGGFDESYFMYMEDVDLGDRLQRAGWLNVFTPSAEISHAKGHAAGAHPEKMLSAHHRSAYKFQADRLTGWKLAPVRLALRIGLAARCRVAVAQAKIRRK